MNINRLFLLAFAVLIANSAILLSENACAGGCENTHVCLGGGDSCSNYNKDDLMKLCETHPPVGCCIVGAICQETWVGEPCEGSDIRIVCAWAFNCW